ncbi:cytochrome C [Neobacillus sp. D3-1R]|uniref:cytochrome C n=1 Tax=Neobacillus sp. D3-1R TaxID=3445778 RepID=UPI003FA066D2
MQKAIIQFVISALLGLGLGYIGFEVIGGQSSNDQKVASPDTTQATENEAESENKDTEEATEVSTDGGILAAKGCLQCHSVGALNIKGGAVGPDLSQAFNNVEGKHGKPINEFLKQPTSAVMSGVIGGNPLTDDEITQVLDLLKEAASK